MLKRLQRGVSLIELLVGIAILALLMAFGVPQYATFLSNARIKASTDTLVSGLSMARAEAVKRNARVEMLLTNEEPIAGIVNDAGLATPNGANWIVRQWVASAGAFEFIEGKFGAEGGGQASTSTVAITSASSGGGYDGTVGFTGFGSLNTGNTITFNITNPSGGACDNPPPGARNPMRCLRVVVSPGGQIRTCDPAVDPTDLTDTRRC